MNEQHLSFNMTNMHNNESRLFGLSIDNRIEYPVHKHQKNSVTVKANTILYYGGWWYIQKQKFARFSVKQESFSNCWIITADYHIHQGNAS